MAAVLGAEFTHRRVVVYFVLTVLLLLPPEMSTLRTTLYTRTSTEPSSVCMEMYECVCGSQRALRLCCYNTKLIEGHIHTYKAPYKRPPSLSAANTFHLQTNHICDMKTARFDYMVCVPNRDGQMD